MRRGYVIGLLIAIGATGAAVLGRRRIAGALGRGAGSPAADGQVQWPFDQNELRTLMERVIDHQREIVAGAENPDARGRAEKFLEYYEGRRAAALGSNA